MTNTTFRTFTGYAAAKLINTQLEQLELDTIPPQMVYNYMKKGYITSSVNSEGKKVVNELELAKWFHKYLEKKGVQSSQVAMKVANTQTRDYSNTRSTV